MTADGKESRERNLYQIGNAVLLIAIVQTCAGEWIGVGLPWGIALAAALPVIALLSGIQFLPVRGKLVCLLAAGGALAAVWLFGAGGLQGAGEAGHAFLWGERSADGTWYYGILRAAAVALLCYLAQFLLERYPAARAAVSGLILAGLLYAMFARRQISHIGVALALLYIVLTLVEMIQSRWVKQRKRDLKAHMVWILPFLGVYFILLLLAPAPEEPYDWQWAKDIGHQVKETFLAVTQELMSGGREDFEVSMSGFSESAGQKGDLAEGSREVMILQGEKGLVTNVYLTGEIYSTFDGRQWLKDEEAPTFGRALDTLETQYAVRRYNDRYQRDYLGETTLTVRYRYFHTGCLFVPLKTRSVTRDGRDLALTREGDNLYFPDKEGYGTTYEVSFYQLNAGQDEFYRFLEDAGEPDGQEWQELLKRCERETGEQIALENVEEYRQEIADRYLQEPQLSEEVREWLEQITEGARTDVQKLIAIEEALSELTYTRTPGELPERVAGEADFLDYFLLESGQGYCTHFATAFVLLARAEGIPARYVQGFCVPMEGKRETKVYSSMAHAWPEAYIEGVGWIPFEPTPGYGSLRYTPWALRQGITVSLTGTAGNGGPEPQGGAGQPPKEANEETVFPEEEDRGSIGRDFLRKTVQIMALTAAVGGILLWAADRLLKRIRYQKADAGGRFAAEVRASLKILSLMGLRRGEQETLQEFRSRAQDGIEQMQRPADLLSFIGVYESMLYGTQEADEEAVAAIRRNKKSLLQLLKRRRRLAWLYCRLRGL